MFRQAALARGITVTAYLGKLVESELRRRKTSQLSVADADQPECDQAIDELDDIAGRLARAAVEHGGSWNDVPSSLRPNARAARDAYGRGEQSTT